MGILPFCACQPLTMVITTAERDGEYLSINEAKLGELCAAPASAPAPVHPAMHERRGFCTNGENFARTASGSLTHLV